MAQPLSRDFFYMRPLVPQPMFDGLGRIFFRPLDRFFRRVTDLAKDASNLPCGVRHVELIFDQLPDAATRPDRVGVAELGRAFFEEAFEFGELLGVEFRRSTGPWFRREGVDAVFVENFSPTFDAGKIAFEDFDDFAIAKSLFDQPAALNAAML